MPNIWAAFVRKFVNKTSFPKLPNVGESKLIFSVLENVGGKISVEMQTPKLLWLKKNLSQIWSKAKHFFDLSDFLTWKATGGSEVRSLCTTVCKWTYEGLLKSWNDSYFRQIGLQDLADEKFERIGSTIMRCVDRFRRSVYATDLTMRF